MAEHADSAQEKLSSSDRPEASPKLSSRGDEGSAEAPNGVASNEASATATVDPDAEVLAAPADDAEDYDAEVECGSKDAGPERDWRSPERVAIVLGLVMIVALGALAGYLGYRGYQSHKAQQERELLLQVGRQGAVNLTTIDWQHADADIQRILDSATGTFYDDFSRRSKPFVELVRKVQSKSAGTVNEAGLESQSGDEAQVLVAVSVNTTNLGAAEQDPRHWRMRISVQKVGDEAKISNVAFVP
jgi:Mce-associated membrane protein